jgi:hypothetical protein
LRELQSLFDEWFGPGDCGYAVVTFSLKPIASLGDECVMVRSRTEEIASGLAFEPHLEAVIVLREEIE